MEVEVLGVELCPKLAQQDKALSGLTQCKYSITYSRSKPRDRILNSLSRILAKILFSYFKNQSRYQLGLAADRLCTAARQREADLYIAHSEAGMWAAEQLRKDGRSVGVDMEDWFSEDLLPEARRARPIQLLKELEKNLLCRGVYSTCASEAMADALVKAYGCRRPTVIRNVFPLKDRDCLDGKWKDRPGMARWMPSNDPQAARPKEAPVSIHWFSQTIGPGRGLEILFQALDGLEGNWEVHLRGNLKGYEKWLEGVCPAGVRGRLKVHGLVENEELLSRIVEHDIGFCGEPTEPANKNVTISNKLFQYLQAGLAVVASDTAGQKEAASEAGGGVGLYSYGDEDELKRILNCLIGKSGDMAVHRGQAWNAGARLCWENERQKLIEAINETLERKRQVFF
jgi:glycosyltransferase involved in cell wall biosynthesis